MSALALFKALGEPTRLEIVVRLSIQNSQTITSLSRGLHLTRQGVRKHMKILEDAEILVLIPHGRETIVQLDKRAFGAGKKFIEKMETHWGKRLGKLKDVLEKRV